MESWTEIKISVDAKDIDRASDIANVVVPYGIYIEDYTNLEQEVEDIAHIDLIDEDLLAKDRNKAFVHIYLEPDVSPSEAVRTAAENAEINGVADRFTAICGSFTDKVEGKYDIVLANIVADAIMFLSKGIKDFMKDDAVYIMSGIIDTRAEEVKTSVSQYFDIIEEHLDNGWACFAARRAAVPRS